MTPRHADRRLSLVLWSALLFSVFLIVHLFRIQVLQHEFYLAEAERQHKRKIVLPPERGDILDRRGDPLALSAEGLNVYAVPERIADKKQVSRILSTYLDLPESIIYRRISSPKPFVMILQKVNPLALAPLQELNLKGVGFISSPKRYYPHHSLAAQIIGYVGVDEKGLSGLEFMYDRKLCGEPGWLVVQRDAKGNPYKLLDYPLHRQSNGKSLRLTIDAQFQEIVEEALCRAVKASGAENGCAVAVNPDNGQLLAVANCPAIDLNSNRKFKENDFLNLAVNLPFEPGSTFKAFTAGALLARGCVEPGDSVFCENGVFRINRRTVRDVHRYGALSFTEVISRSSNIGMTKLIRKIGD
ncbi:MAG: penicillin-binding transpeptidase domain-containing protein, partial [Gemmatimonadota bacterium]|nr:penicillin-binding transpeptidase domain-containing protein [Gemmatimonadota bacterium]